jgi:hypothetical protein
VPDGRCGEPGPWGAVCTEDSLHRYSCYDGSKDTSWQSDWRTWLDDDADEDTRRAFFESEPEEASGA